MAISIDTVCVCNASIIRHQNPHKKSTMPTKQMGYYSVFRVLN